MKNKNQKNNKPLIVVGVLAVFLIISIICFVFLPSGTEKNSAEDTKETTTDSSTEPMNNLGGGDYWDGKGEKLMSGKVNAVIDIQDYGTITVELDADSAPVTVTNFVKLAKDGFYDGLTFHRIMSGFMMQGGDPLGNGTGGSDENILGEFPNNGVNNTLSHTKGAISMARSQMYNSASSQFFICHDDATFLDGDYACFGYVTSGIDVVDKVCESASPVDNNGTILPESQPVITSITIEE